ncbi:putative terminal uridylyltransferase 3 [Trypanosoma theileri]|uniref:RNA uridylyltransferase n=1 Tax=Trypanosoma theileri TaxID=67003 RepID=A0A1X0NKT1_9TRYP|nr:putative terminal uridylyltransferase 3 [Trypanosoma theileri]ORC85191.1 putative terminal uridylyltransferase 3 [Trypanosoma theileri]
MDPQTAPLEINEMHDRNDESLRASENEGRVANEGEGELGEMKEEEKASALKFTCDLCDVPVDRDELDAHLQENHAALLHLCDHYLSDIRDELVQLDTQTEYIKTLAEFVEESVVYLDKGPEAFDIVLRATMQLDRIMRGIYPVTHTFLFGSCVSYGSWDGVGDADFVILHPAQLEEGKNILEDERRAVFAATRKLRDVGFLFEELEPVVRASVPVVRRVQKERPPLHIPQYDDKFKIKYEFKPQRNDIFLKRLIHKVQKMHGIVEESGNCELTASYKSGLDAVAAFRQARRDELENVTWSWRTDCCLPEMFFLDFDVSFRPFGLRNSWLMRLYLMQSPEVRAGAAFLKKWSKRCGINNPIKGFLTSYAVNVLWVSYLLHVAAVEFVDPASVPLLPEKANNVTYLPLLPLQDPSYSSLRLGELLIGFFHHYSNFAWNARVVSLRVPGGSVCRSELKWTIEWEVVAPRPRDRVWYRLCVEDPYEADRNLGRHLSPAKAAFVHAQFPRALQHVRRGTPEKLLVDVRRNAAAALSAIVHRAVYGEGVETMPLADAHNFFTARVNAAGGFDGPSDGEELLGYYEVSRSLRSLCNELEAVAEARTLTRRLRKPRTRVRRRNRHRTKHDETTNGGGGKEIEQTDTEATEMKATHATESKLQEENETASELKTSTGSESKDREKDDNKEIDDKEDDVNEAKPDDDDGNKSLSKKAKHRDMKDTVKENNNNNNEEKACNDEDIINQADDTNRKESEDRDNDDNKKSNDKEDDINEDNHDDDDGNKSLSKKAKHRDMKDTVKENNNNNNEEKACNDEDIMNQADDTNRKESEDRDNDDDKKSNDKEDDINEDNHDDDGDDDDHDDGKSDNDDKERILLSLHACFLETEEKMRLAGRLGIPADDVPGAVRGAYFFAYDRAFYTLEEKETFERHADAILQVFSDSSKTNENVYMALQRQIPTVLRDDALILELLDAHSKHELLAIDKKKAPLQPVVRSKPTDVKKARHSTRVQRASHYSDGVCSECNRKDVRVWPTTDRVHDPGMYCDSCWRVYENSG